VTGRFYVSVREGRNAERERERERESVACDETGAGR
jgi:hypothetical protein